MTLKAKLDAWRDALSATLTDEFFKRNPNGFTVSPYCNSDVVSSCYEIGFDALMPLLIEACEGLSEIASWQVGGTFDEPWSADQARRLLASIEKKLEGA